MATGRIRPFVDEDIPQVARLHDLVFRTGAAALRDGRERYRDYFTRVFLDNPAVDAALPSLVYQDDDGRVVGFLGVVPRLMSIEGERVKAAISSQFVVDPTCRTALVAVQLASRFLGGPQDIAISDEANDVSRRIWEGLGGTTALLHSMYWVRPLRPAQCAGSWLRNGGLAPLMVIADPALRLVDALATHVPRSHFYQAKPSLPPDDLCVETVLARFSEFTTGELRVEYDCPTLEWLLDQARRRRPGSTLRKAVIRSEQAVRGWYLYDLDSSGLADVLQIAAKPESIHEVLDHLFYDAWHDGATAVTGRVEPRFLQALSDKYCFFHRRGPWMLVSSKRPELLRAFQNGSAVFSRFDGEWCLGFGGTQPVPWSRS